MTRRAARLPKRRSSPAPALSSFDWRAGYGACDITPPPGHTMMAGFGHERYAEGALGRLRGQATALQDGTGRTVLLLTADILGFDPTTQESIRRKLRAEHGLGAEAILFAASHTHWSPGAMYRMNYSAGTINPWYLKRLEEGLLSAAQQALKFLRPARVRYTALQTRIGHCRRSYGPGGAIVWGPNLQGHYDEHTPVLLIDRRVARSGGPSRIILVGHACHPTSTGAVAKWSPEYPGAMRDVLERDLGPGTKALFVMGCGADAKVTHLDSKTGKAAFSASPQRARAAGEKLAKEVTRHLAHNKPLDLTPRLQCRLVSGELTFAKPMSGRQIEEMAYARELADGNVWWARQMINYPDPRRTLPYRVQCWRLGDELTILSLEGEVCSPLGPLARSLAQTPQAMTIAYANTVAGYIPSARIVREGGYEGESSHRAYLLPAPFTPRVEEEFRQIVRRATGGQGMH